MVCCELEYDHVPLNLACVGMYIEIHRARTVTLCKPSVVFGVVYCGCMFMKLCGWSLLV